MNSRSGERDPCFMSNKPHPATALDKKTELRTTDY